MPRAERTRTGRGARSGRPPRRLADRGFDDRLVSFGQGALVVKLLAVTLLFDPAASDAFSLPKAAISRATMVILVGVLVGLVYRHGLRALPLGSWIARSAAAYVALLAFSIPFALDLTLALFGAPTRLLGVATAGDLLITLVAVAALLRDRRDARLVGVLVLGCGAAVVAYEFVQAVGRDPIRGLGVVSTIGNTAVLGAFVAVIGSLALGTLLGFWPSLTPGWRAALATFAAATVAGVLVSGSRAGALALLAGMTACVVLALRKELLRPRAAFGLGAATLVFMAAALSPVSPIGRRAIALVTEGDPERAEIAGIVLDVVRERPLVGAGPDNLLATYQSRRSAATLPILSAEQVENSTHGSLMQAALSAGIPGLIAFLAMTIFAVTSAWRLSRLRTEAAVIFAGLVAFLVQALVTPDHITVLTLFWTGLGAVIALERSVDRDPPPAEPRGVDALALGIAVLATAAIGAGVTWRAVLASEAHLWSLQVTNAAAAVASARTAVDLDPGRAQHWAGLGRAQSVARDTAAALRSFESAAERAPYLSGLWRNVAQARLELAGTDPGRLGSARDAAERAIRAQPVDPAAHALLARISLQLGDGDGAIASARRAIELVPATAGAHEVLGVALAQRGRLAEAEQAVREGLTADPTSLALRRLLTQILLAKGDADLASEIISPPRIGELVSCGARCYKLTFVCLIDLAWTGPGSPLARERYLVAGAGLPDGVVIERDGDRSVTLRWPRELDPPASNTALFVRDVRNDLGMAMKPQVVYVP